VATLEGSTRPLTEAEKRLLRWAVSHRERRLRKALRGTLSWGAIVLGVLWIFSIFATIIDERGPSWYLSGLIWLVIALPMTLWSYAGVRSDLAKAVRRFESAMRLNTASTVRIQSTEMVEFEEEEDKGVRYAFQLTNGRMVFLSGQEFYPSPQFPNSDFSLVDIRSEDGTTIVGHIERRGRRIEQSRTIPAKKASALKIPDHLQIITGNLSRIEQLLS
jgi:hypothetical protein